MFNLADFRGGNQNPTPKILPIFSLIYSKGPRTPVVDTLALKYLYRDYSKSKVYSIYYMALVANQFCI